MRSSRRVKAEFRVSPVSWFDEVGLKPDQNGLIKLSEGKRTSADKIYNGGDMVTGADLVVTAIAEGRDAAMDILKELNVI